jgi:hypothetical protein
MYQCSQSLDGEEVFSTLADTRSVSILDAAYTGFPSSSNGVAGLTKKQFYIRLKRLVDIGLVEKTAKSVYKLTTFGLLVYRNHLKTMDKLIPAYWQIKGIDALQSRLDFPIEQRESLVKNFLATTSMHNKINATQFTSYSVVKAFDSLIPEVLKVLDNAEKEVYFATKYHDPHISNLVFKKFREGASIHILDGNPEQISVEKRLAAIVRTPPNKEIADMVKKILRSSRFDLKRVPNLPISFMVVDRVQVVYETINFTSPEQFSIAISKYDDTYTANQFIDYFRILSKNALPAKLLEILRNS